MSTSTSVVDCDVVSLVEERSKVLFERACLLIKDGMAVEALHVLIELGMGDLYVARAQVKAMEGRLAVFERLMQRLADNVDASGDVERLFAGVSVKVKKAADVYGVKGSENEKQ